MTRSMTNLFRLSIGTVLGAAVLLWNGHLPIDPQASLVSSAEARVGRPLTPMSYAGVARRTTRRAVGLARWRRVLRLWPHRWWSHRPARRSWTHTDGLPPSADKVSG